MWKQICFSSSEKDQNITEKTPSQLKLPNFRSRNSNLKLFFNNLMINDPIKLPKNTNVEMKILKTVKLIKFNTNAWNINFGRRCWVLSYFSNDFIKMGSTGLKKCSDEMPQKTKLRDLNFKLVDWKNG